jgi:hypothetical protein
MANTFRGRPAASLVTTPRPWMWRIPPSFLTMRDLISYSSPIREPLNVLPIGSRSSGWVTAADLNNMRAIMTLQGQEPRITPPKWYHLDKLINVDEATIIKENIVVSNGISHSIDFVLIPK